MKKITPGIYALGFIATLAFADNTVNTKVVNPNKVLPNSPNQLLQAHQQQTDNKQRYMVLFRQQFSKNNPVNYPSVFTEEGFNLQKASRWLTEQGGTVLREFRTLPSIATALTQKQKQKIEQHPEILLIEPDPERFLQATPQDLDLSEKTPYGLSQAQIDLVAASAEANKKICIIDTGYDLGHEDFTNAANITGEVVNNLSEAVDLGKWSEDSYGHGTHIAGVLSALDNDIGTKGIYGDGELKLHIVKIIHDPNYWRMWGSDMIAAIEQCEAAGADIINMSIAGTDSSSIEQIAMQTAVDNGLLLVAASGNRGNSDEFFPASYPAVVSVGAVDTNNDVWAYSQHNQQTELTAAGVSVYSTLPNNTYSYWDGTSIATPYVSGVAAIVWSAFPECTNEEIREVLAKSALDLGEPGRDDFYGNGIIQAQAALDLLGVEGCNQAVEPVVEPVTDSGSLNNSEPVGNIGEDIPVDTWVDQIAGNGMVCSVPNSGKLQIPSDGDNSGSVTSSTGVINISLDIGQRSFGFNANTNGGTAVCIVVFANGQQTTIPVNQNGFVGLNSDQDIVQVIWQGEPGSGITNFQRSSPQTNGATQYNGSDGSNSFNEVATTQIVEDLNVAPNQNIFTKKIKGKSMTCSSNNNVGIVSPGSGNFSIPNDTSAVTSNGYQDLFITFNTPPNQISFNTFTNGLEPCTLIISFTDGTKNTYNINHSPNELGFFALNSTKKIASMRWINNKGWLINTGITNIQADVITEDKPVCGPNGELCEDLPWVYMDEANGLAWAWASPCSGSCSTPVVDGVDGNMTGWRFPTTIDWGKRPDASVWNQGQAVDCAALIFDPTFDHCDWEDGEAGFISRTPNNDIWETWFVHDLTP